MTFETTLVLLVFYAPSATYLVQKNQLEGSSQIENNSPYSAAVNCLYLFVYGWSIMKAAPSKLATVLSLNKSCLGNGMFQVSWVHLLLLIRRKILKADFLVLWVLKSFMPLSKLLRLRSISNSVDASVQAGLMVLLLSILTSHVDP